MKSATGEGHADAFAITEDLGGPSNSDMNALMGEKNDDLEEKIY